jgi:diguanylate cyclase (GGDEF)-like protein/PAS domain S-box-containing protein
VDTRHVDGLARGAPVTVGSLSVLRIPLPGSTSTGEIEQAFERDPDLRSVVVLHSDGKRQLLNRGPFYQALVGPRGFGYALFYNKPVSHLPVAAALCLPGDTLASVAGTALLAREDLSAADDILVDLDGTPATVAVSRVLAEVAHSHEQQALRFGSLVSNLSDVLIIVDLDGEVRYLSPSYHRITGRDPLEGLGVPVADLVLSAERPAVDELLLRAQTDPGRTVEVELHLALGDEQSRTFDVLAQDLTADPLVAGYLLTFRDVTERRRLEEELRYGALHDPLTGLPNRRLLLDRADQALTAAAHPGGVVAVAWVDLDGFKAVNDTCGHATGDAVLKAVAARMHAELRSCDLVARMGGDEFAVLLVDLRAEGDAEAAVARLHRSFDDPIVVDGRKLSIRASVGLATAVGAVAAEELLHCADIAMYAAKAQGKNRIVVWRPDIETDVLAEQEMLLEIEMALGAGQFEVHYQPIVQMDTGKTTVVEALARWHHPERGPIPPSLFIPLAERSGAITPLTRWVLRAACTQAKAWNDVLDATELVVAVNLSGVELSRTDLLADVAAALDATGLPARCLELELTETALISNFSTARRALQSLRALGVRIAIDDFGTGYSSLSYLHELPVDRMKIDKCFVDGILERDGHELVQGLIRLAHSLGLAVTAEGVELPGQRQILTDMGCDYAQGYLFARPAPAHQLDMASGTGGAGRPDRTLSAR